MLDIYIGTIWQIPFLSFAIHREPLVQLSLLSSSTALRIQTPLLALLSPTVARPGSRSEYQRKWLPASSDRMSYGNQEPHTSAQYVRRDEQHYSQLVLATHRSCYGLLLVELTPQ